MFGEMFVTSVVIFVPNSTAKMGADMFTNAALESPSYERKSETLALHNSVQQFLESYNTLPFITFLYMCIMFLAKVMRTDSLVCKENVNDER